MVEKYFKIFFILVFGAIFSCTPDTLTYDNSDWIDIEDHGTDKDSSIGDDKDIPTVDGEPEPDEDVDDFDMETDDEYPDTETNDEDPGRSCYNVDCSGKGFCFLNDGVAECFCRRGYHDEFPECVENDPSSPCKGVSCSDGGTCFDAGGILSDPICHCDTGFLPIGLTCLKNISGNPCDYVDCGPNTDCSVSIEDGLKCDCEKGFIPADNGWGCKEDIPDPCEGVDCGANGKCVEKKGGAECVCDEGYFWDGKECVLESEKTCEFVDCSGHGECKEFGGEMYCVCDEGYYAKGLQCLPETGPECKTDFDCFFKCGPFAGTCVDSKCECE